MGLFIKNSILLFLASFLLTYFLIPRIIYVVQNKNLLDKPNERSSHSKHTPTLGGVAFFCAIMISVIFLQIWDLDQIIYNLIPSLTILFVIGIKDDLVEISPKTKLISQIIAISCILMNSGLTVTSLDGFLGLYDLNPTFFIFFSGFTVLFIINSFNLIDGIDGLASLIGILIFVTFFFLFFLFNLYFYSLICLVLVAVLLAFLKYNFSEKTKIFMGDTGSMILGLVIGMMVVKLNSIDFNNFENLFFKKENLPVIIIGTFIVPLFDTVRVFMIRIFNGNRFFEADKNHLHHIFLDYGYSHKKITLITVTFNLIFILITTLLSIYFNSVIILTTQIVLLLILALYLFKIKLNNHKTFSTIKKNALTRLATSILNIF